MKPFEEYLSYDGKDSVVTWKEYRAGAAENRKKTIRYETGFPEFDTFVDGVASGELIVVSGNTGQGKTLFVKSLVRGFASQDVPTTVFSYEVPTDQFLESYEDLPRCETLYVPKELKTNDVAWIKEKVIEARAKYDNKIVVIDHLHYIVEMSSQKNFSLTVGEALRKLKQEIAIGLNQVVVLICHQQSLGGEVEPSISTIRDSSFTGQEADMVLIVHRIPDRTHLIVADGAHDRKEKIPPQDWTYDNGQAFVKIDKARRTGVYKKKCTFQKRGAWLEPL